MESRRKCTAKLTRISGQAVPRPPRWAHEDAAYFPVWRVHTLGRELPSTLLSLLQDQSMHAKRSRRSQCDQGG